MKIWEVWVEGFTCTGNSSSAEFLGGFTAETFDAAVQEAFKDREPEKYLEKSNGGYWSYWGCCVFDNGEEAMKRFG